MIVIIITIIGTTIEAIITGENLFGTLRETAGSVIILLGFIYTEKFGELVYFVFKSSCFIK